MLQGHCTKKHCQRIIEKKSNLKHSWYKWCHFVSQVQRSVSVGPATKRPRVDRSISVPPTSGSVLAMLERRMWTLSSAAMNSIEICLSSILSLIVLPRAPNLPFPKFFPLWTADSSHSGQTFWLTVFQISLLIIFLFQFMFNSFIISDVWYISSCRVFWCLPFHHCVSTFITIASFISTQCLWKENDSVLFIVW